MANPRKIRLIYANKRKSDKPDAENLARLARLDPKLLYPLKHRGEESRARMAPIRSRRASVGCRTRLVNHVRGAVESFGARLPERIPEALRRGGSRAWVAPETEAYGLFGLNSPVFIHSPSISDHQSRASPRNTYS